MTSTELVQNEIIRFLRSSVPEVLCISGEWGVGKTFTWQTMLDQAVSAESIGLGRYAYVSLFGINSLDSLKMTTFENSQFLLPEAETNNGLLMKLGGNVLGFLQKNRRVAEGVPWVGNAFAQAGPLYFSLVRNQIVCIDDLERRGVNLEVMDVLGLVSFLKEQRKCKVVLLLNDNELDVEGKIQLTNHFEKVVDVGIRFTPKPNDSVRIALTDGDKASQILGEHCKTLGIYNIRVIKKIERLVRDIEPLLAKFEEEVFGQAIHTLALLGWSKFQPTMAPSLEYLQKERSNDYFGLEEKQNLSPDRAAWAALLGVYKFGIMDDFDLELLKSLENGFFNPIEIEKQGTALDKNIKAQKEDGSFSEAWNIYHDSFANNQDEVINTIYNSFKKTFQNISPINLNGTVRLFRELDRNDLADEIIRYYIENRDEDRNFWDINDYAFGNEITDSGVLKAFASKLATYKNEIDPFSILFRIGANNTWNAHDLATLASLSVDDYYKLFKTYNGKDLRKIINGALQFVRISNASEEMREISKRARDALTKIGGESVINARRVRKFGIDIGKPVAVTKGVGVEFFEG